MIHSESFYSYTCLPRTELRSEYPSEETDSYPGFEGIPHKVLR